MAETYPDLVRELEREGVIHTPRIRDTMQHVDRRGFMPPDVADQAAEDAPVPIGFGQTISQPRTVAFMLELLQPQTGERVLDVGAGSGWTAALLAGLVGDTGRVYAVERIPQLRNRAEANVRAAGFPAVAFTTGDGSSGWKAHAPYDIIHVAAGAKRFPDALAEQLAPGGRMVVPVGEYVQEMVKAVRGADGLIAKTFHGTFSFVPLIED
jgi:protein-L-isoaspartate(D-aspartate) O-methyltransferase